MIKIDFHVHLAIGIDRLLNILKENNICKAVVIPYDFEGVEFSELIKYLKKSEKPKEYINRILKNLDKINERFMDNIKPYKKLIPAPWISPENENLESFINESKIIKFIPVLDNFTKDYFKRARPYIEMAVKKNKLIMIHTGWGTPVWPIINLAKQYPEGIFIIAHMKEDDDFMMLERLKALKYPNIYCETSYGPGPHRIEQFVEKGFGDKLLYGSDFRTSKSSLKWYIAQIEFAEISEQAKRKIFYENALKLLE